MLETLFYWKGSLYLGKITKQRVLKSATSEQPVSNILITKIDSDEERSPINFHLFAHPIPGMPCIEDEKVTIISTHSLN